MRNDIDGFTLIEVLVGLMITGLLVLSFTQVLYNAQKCNMWTSNYYLAVNWTQSLIELIKEEKSNLRMGSFQPEELLTSLQYNKLKEHFPLHITGETIIKVDKMKRKEIFILQVLCNWEVNNAKRCYQITTYYYPRSELL